MFNKIHNLKSILLILGFLLIASLIVTVYVYNHGKERTSSIASQSLTATTEAPYTDIDGEVIDLAQYSNQVRVVNSWATWSPLSKEELPVLDKLAESYIESGVIFLAINRRENKDYANAYLRTLPELKNFQIVYDPVDNFFSKVDGFAMPETIVFNKEGIVAAHYRGLVKPEELASVLDELVRTD